MIYRYVDTDGSGANPPIPFGLQQPRIYLCDS